jgi:hypothetical protein
MGDDDWMNWYHRHPKCPQPFRNIGFDRCVVRCPADKKFEIRGTQDGVSCVYRPDEQFKYSLTPLAPTIFRGWSIDELKRMNPQAATEFTTELDRAEKDLAVVYANIDKQQKINDAFKDLQKAENARDQSPSAYQTARTAYYTLVKGADWINEERQRISNAEVSPEVQKYRDAVKAVNVRTQEQQKTIDVVNGIKDKVLSLKDDFKYSVNTFSDQLEKVKIQLNMENRSRMKEQPTEQSSSWLDIGLNIGLVLALLYAIYTFVRRSSLVRSPAQSPLMYLFPSTPGVGGPGQLR